MSKENIQELYPTSDDDSRIQRQARLNSNFQTTKPTLESIKREENSLVCVTSDGWEFYL